MVNLQNEEIKSIKNNFYIPSFKKNLVFVGAIIDTWYVTKTLSQIAWLAKQKPKILY
jgi:hypothetical protein